MREPKIRFRFLNFKTETVSDVFLPVGYDTNMEEGVVEDNIRALLNCERAVSGDPGQEELDILFYDQYIIWTVPGNAVKSYDKIIANDKDRGISVMVRLVA